MTTRVSTRNLVNAQALLDGLVAGSDFREKELALEKRELLESAEALGARVWEYASSEAGKLAGCVYECQACPGWSDCVTGYVVVRKYELAVQNDWARSHVRAVRDAALTYQHGLSQMPRRRTAESAKRERDQITEIRRAFRWCGGALEWF